jgi:benzoyl-CoA reductase/2-hydroxyglutaryl-CoA dehydratase subunit BcrC/BadD/HgdB
MDSYDKLMEICGFEPDEAVEYKPTLKQGLAKLLVTEKDVEFAVTERIPQCWSIHLKGIRKLLGCWLREYIRVAVPEPGETRLCHTYFAQPGMAYLHPIKLADPTIQIGAPDWVASFVGSSFFNVGWKYVEAAEREGCAVEQITCSLNKIRYGLHVLGIIPRADMSIGFHTFCDDGPLVEQLIHEWDGTEVCTPYRVRDIHFGGDPFDEENIKYFAASLEDGHRQVEKVLNIKITPEHLAKSRELFVNLSSAIFIPMIVAMKADPVPLNANDLAFALMPVATAFDTGYDRILEAETILQAEVTQMIAEGKGVMPKGTPRVSWRLLPSWGCPWLVPMCHELGLAADFEEAFLLGGTQLMKSIEAQSETNMYMMMAKQLAMVSALGTSLEYLYKTTTDHITEYGIDGFIATNYRPCRCWTAHSQILAKMLGERSGTPCITPDLDIYIDRGDFPQSRMRTVLETFADVVKRSKDKKLKIASQGGN